MLEKLILVVVVLAALAAARAFAAEADPELAFGGPNAVGFETQALRFHLNPDTGQYAVLDRAGRAVWRSAAQAPARFGKVQAKVDGKDVWLPLDRCEAKATADAVTLKFHPVKAMPEHVLRVTIRAALGGKALDFEYMELATDRYGGLDVERVKLLDEALWVTGAKSYIAVPVREGLFIPADNGVTFRHEFDTYTYEGCHMEMLGLVREGAAALVTWDDPYVVAEVKSEPIRSDGAIAGQVLAPSLTLRKTARSFRVRFLGQGDSATIARAYREVAAEKGYLVTWDEKLKGHADRAKYFGAANYKLWATLSRQMNEDSTKEERHNVAWTFDEAAQIAEHLKTDLKLDRVLFIMGGWIHRGYDNQHPDILPTAPECGGDEKFADCCRRVRALGYLLSLHDNYQDMYKDAPSWDESCLMRNPDGSLQRGGRWAGGWAYLTCSKRAVDLAKRPQNLQAVQKLSGADSYFIDTTYAAGLCECFAKDHPLTRADDMHWKQEISDYARGVFGSFGSECGREWAVPHADFFEGMTGVSGGYYHDANLLKGLGAVPVPLFEMVYRDTIAMYGKYGYDIHRASEYVLWHALLGRPLNYHNVPAHLYWKTPAAEAGLVDLEPAVADFKAAAPRQFEITYRWAVGKAPPKDWKVFVHFTPPDGKKIAFQNDHDPQPPTSQWKPGQVQDGPFGVTVPGGLDGTFDIRIGLFSTIGEPRARLKAVDDGEGRIVIGRVKVTGDTVEFLPPDAKAAPAAAGDPGLFVRADGGWADGMHPYDRFTKNTYEVLSPLNEMTSRVTMTRHEFLTPDRTVRRTVFGEGEAAVTVTVNLGAAPFEASSKLGGKVTLPAYGLLVDSPTFVAFHASSFGGLAYASAPLFTLRSLDGRPLAESKKIRVFHGFGDPRIKLGGAARQVVKEEIGAW